MQPRGHCEECVVGKYLCYHSHIEKISNQPVRVRYYRCNNCGHRPDDNKTVTRAKFQPKSIKMSKFSGKSSKDSSRRSGPFS